MTLQVVNALLGVWLMAAPAAFGYTGAPRINDLIVGPIAASLATVAIWDVCRSLGKANVVLGAWLLVAPWVLSYDAFQATLNSSATGILLAVSALLSGGPRGRYGGGWSFLWKQSQRQRSG
jgi:hypothetical protein